MKKVIFLYCQLLSLIDGSLLRQGERCIDVHFSILYIILSLLTIFSVNKMAPNSSAFLHQKGVLITPLFCLPFGTLFPAVQYIFVVWDDQNIIPKMASPWVYAKAFQHTDHSVLIPSLLFPAFFTAGVQWVDNFIDPKISFPVSYWPFRFHACICESLDIFLDLVFITLTLKCLSLLVITHFGKTFWKTIIIYMVFKHSGVIQESGCLPACPWLQISYE